LFEQEARFRTEHEVKMELERRGNPFRRFVFDAVLVSLSGSAAIQWTVTGPWERNIWTIGCRAG
jgi:hypothetical protein